MPTNHKPSLSDGTESGPTGGTADVTSVPNRSPFRYPGGKTWLVPAVRRWLHDAKRPRLVEPFCGGGSVGLTAAAENLAGSVTMIELDADVASVWRAVLTDADWLVDAILSFEPTRENVLRVTACPSTDRERAFATIVRNRTNRGGILAPGAGMLKNGENGRGIASRWYPATLARRIREIGAYKSKITFIEGDAFDFLGSGPCGADTYCFIDAPYTLAGRRLYRHSDINHELLFEKTAGLGCHYLMTYDLNDHIVSLAEKHGMQHRTAPMRTAHHVEKRELLISDDLSWL